RVRHRGWLEPARLSAARHPIRPAKAPCRSTGRGARAHQTSLDRAEGHPPWRLLPHRRRDRASAPDAAAAPTGDGRWGWAADAADRRARGADRCACAGGERTWWTEAADAHHRFARRADLA